MALGTESKVEDVSAGAGGSTVRSKEQVGASTESAVWLSFGKMNHVGKGDQSHVH